MSMTLTRPPLESIGMNSGGVPKRRSARLSADSVEENEPPVKKSKANGVEAHKPSAQRDDGDAGANSKRKRAVYEEQDDFMFSRSKKAKAKAPAVRTSEADRVSPTKGNTAPPRETIPVTSEDAAPKKALKKKPRRFSTFVKNDDTEQPVRRSKRLSDEHETDPQASPHRAAHAKSHANHARSPSPFRPARPLTVEKKRHRLENGVEEEKITRIQLPFADTPVIKRNKEMRKSSAENGSRRSSSGMRGRRASSLMDEGRGNALPHAEVSAAEFYKHISADLTEPRRMRCLLSWCGIRALPPKPEAPKDSTPSANLEFQALQAARVIQEELAQDLITKGSLSDWFSRDESAPSQIPLRKKPNPRNVANAAKAEELERELARLRDERAQWDQVIASAPKTSPKGVDADSSGSLSPIRSDLLDSPQRAILEQLRASTSEPAIEPTAIQQRLREISDNLEFTVDQFAHGIHALTTVKETADRVADRTLSDAAHTLEAREKDRRIKGKAVDPMDALKGLAKILNSQQR